MGPRLVSFRFVLQTLVNLLTIDIYYAMSESIGKRSIDDLFGTKDDLFKLDWQSYMYW